MAKLSALGHVGLAFETTAGTAVAPLVWVPYNTIKVDDEIKKVTDDARRGVLSKDFGVYNTTRHGTVEIDTHVYPETLGYFLKGIMGQDTVTGSAAPYTHTFKVVNALAPSLTVSDYNTMTERQYAMSVVSEVALKFDAENTMSLKTKLMSKSSVVSTTSTPVFSVSDPFKGFTGQLTWNGTGNANLDTKVSANLVGGELNIKREVKMLYTLSNTVDPSKYSAARIEVEGKLTFDVESEDELNVFLNSAQPNLGLVFVRDANTSITFQMSKVDISKANVDRSQEFIRVDLQYRAIHNSTDGGMVAITLKNSVASY